jgi:CheY-like chemotaxis protein
MNLERLTAETWRSDHLAAIPLKILVVEDEASSRLALRDLLVEEGFEVSTAEDGAEGIALARDIHPDLVFLDLVLPNVNGFEAASVLKHDDSTADIPIVAVTASWLGGEGDRLLGAGFDAALRKPFGHDELLGTLRRLIHYS